MGRFSLSSGISYLAASLMLFAPLFANADVSIETLIQQANIKEGATAIRELPRYSGARKIIVRDLGFDFSDIASQYPDLELITVSSTWQAKRHARDADAIAGFCDADLIAAAPNLAWVQIYSAGAEGCLSVDAIGSGDVVLSNMQKMSSPVIAEHAISMMMALVRNLPRAGRRMDEAQWDRRTLSQGMSPIAGKKLLVIGLGGIGTEVARLGDALGMRVVGTRNSSREGPSFVEYVGLPDELIELAASADVIVNALPLTQSTEGLLDASFFSATKENAIFVNVGRGKTVVTDALLEALESGRLYGAGLDVTEPEPLPSNHRLWQLENVIITPHLAGSGGERQRHIALFTENLRRYVAGEKLLNVVDPEKGY